ncbi:uncharacterized protein LOC118753227 [Rhagoletis pomonella]|uniref:uncharacterized protein LOC118753227 n=1 Tax=Rhagoletis pomonella TaxID=28610 RepID=UPI0017827E23|nr:uncharacterized protein LOC118753227 [Rhagoletis pomonella]
MLLQHIFTNLSGFDEKSWSNIIDPHLAQCTANFLFKLVGQVTPVISLDRYAEPYYIVERGAIDDKVNFLATSLEQTDTNQFTIKELEYVRIYVYLFHLFGTITKSIVQNPRFRMMAVVMVWKICYFLHDDQFSLNAARLVASNVGKILLEFYYNVWILTFGLKKSGPLLFARWRFFNSPSPANQV